MLRMKASPTEKLLYLLKWLLDVAREARCAQRFDHCLVVSPIELRLLQASQPGVQASLIENGINTTLHQPLAEPAGK